MSTYDTFDEQKKFACRVIADHARATAFSIADGILPGNEGRNYVLRKIMRRAIYQGRHALGLEDAFFYKVTNFVVDQMSEAYPELEIQRGFIEKMVRLEEERFGSTLSVGLKRLDEAIEEYFAETKKNAIQSLRGIDSRYHNYDTSSTSLQSVQHFRELYRNEQTLEELPHPMYSSMPEVFSSFWARRIEDPENISKLIKTLARVYDTFGTSRDLILVILRERGFGIDDSEFAELFARSINELQTQSQKAPTRTHQNAKAIHVALSRRHDTKTEFAGYETTHTDNAKVIALIKDDKEVNELRKNDEGEVVLDQTPFYAESGGQVGDTGTLIGSEGLTKFMAYGKPNTKGAIVRVVDTYTPAQSLIVHKVKVEKGTLKVGDVVTAEVDVEKRDATRRNHTATHLMHAALREVLGTHVKQAGSVVAPNYLRFDFSHYQPLTGAEIEEIERLVNYHILRNEPVQTDEMAVEEAMRSGAMALFGEKYGEKVRVLSIKGAEGIFSKELCGGTHVRATGDIGVFKITSDESIASGVRRIRAVTGVDAYERFREDEEIISQVTTNLRTSRAELPAMIGKLQDELKKARREADELKLKIATGAAGSAASNGDDAREVAGVRVLVREASGLDSAGMRQLSDTLLARIKSGVVVIGRSNDGKASLIVRTSDDLTKKVPAGLVIKELAPIIGGKGGGKADMAEGGGNQPEKLAEALEASYGVIERMLS